MGVHPSRSGNRHSHSSAIRKTNADEVFGGVGWSGRAWIQTGVIIRQSFSSILRETNAYLFWLFRIGVLFAFPVRGRRLLLRRTEPAAGLGGSSCLLSQPGRGRWRGGARRLWFLRGLLTPHRLPRLQQWVMRLFLALFIISFRFPLGFNSERFVFLWLCVLVFVEHDFFTF